MVPVYSKTNTRFKYMQYIVLAILVGVGGGYIVDSTEPSLGRNSKMLLLSNVEIRASVSFESILLLVLNPLLRSNTRGLDMKYEVAR